MGIFTGNSLPAPVLHHTHVHHHHYSNIANTVDPTESSRLDGIVELLSSMKEVLMTVSAEVQQALDQARKSNSVVASVDAGMKALQAQVTQLQAQIANGTPSLSADDKVALTEISNDLANSITTLQADIPANTTAAGANPAPGTSNTAS